MKHVKLVYARNIRHVTYSCETYDNLSLMIILSIILDFYNRRMHLA